MKGNETVDQIQDTLSKVYKNTSISTHQILNRLDESSTYLGRSLSTGENTERFLIKSLAWLFAFSNKVSISTQDATIRRYPEYCPFCIEKNCVCEFTKRTPKITSFRRDEELAAKYETIQGQISFQKLRPTLDYFQKTISNIYPINSTRWNLNRYEMLKRLDHKRAKINEFYRRYEGATSESNKKNITLPVADFFAWLIGIWDVIYSKQEAYSIQEVFLTHYKEGCPYCHSTTCTCTQLHILEFRSDHQIPLLKGYQSDDSKTFDTQIEALKDLVETIPSLNQEKTDIDKIIKNSKSQSKDGLIQSLESLKVSIIEKGENKDLIKHVTGLIEWVNDYGTH